MDIKPIKTDTDYRAALSEIEKLMTAEPDTPGGEELDVWVTLVEAYEREHYPLALPDPIEAIKFAMEQKGLTVKDLEPMIGKSNRVYEVLNHKRPLTLKMILRPSRWILTRSRAELMSGSAKGCWVCTISCVRAARRSTPARSGGDCESWWTRSRGN